MELHTLEIVFTNAIQHIRECRMDESMQESERTRIEK